MPAQQKSVLQTFKKLIRQDDYCKKLTFEILNQSRTSEAI